MLPDLRRLGFELRGDLVKAPVNVAGQMRTRELVHGDRVGLADPARSFFGGDNSFARVDLSVYGRGHRLLNVAARFLGKPARVPVVINGGPSDGKRAVLSSNLLGNYV